MAETGAERKQSGARLGRTRRKRRFIYGILVVAAIVCAFYVRRFFDVETELAAAGLGRLPGSATNVEVARRGDLFGWRTTFIRFEAQPDDIRVFITASTVSMVPEGAKGFSMGPRGDRPSWFQPPESDPYGSQARFRLPVQQSYGGGILVDYSNDSVYVALVRKWRINMRSATQ